MKNLLLIALVAGVSCYHPMRAADPVKAAGKWQLALTTPHGTINGTLDLEQDGAKVSGSYATDQMGTVAVTGVLDGKKISLAAEFHGNGFKLIGAVEGPKMSGTTDPEGGTWTATRQSITILGSVAAIDVGTLQFTVKPDSGASQRFRVGSETQVVQVAPGEQDLSRGVSAIVASKNADEVLLEMRTMQGVQKTTCN